MKQWKINLVNYVFYEIVIVNLALMSWRGIYDLLDEFFFVDDTPMSLGICLLIGYALYFPLMYSQASLERLNFNYPLSTLFAANFPNFFRHARHLLAFVSCVCVWRGFWMLYDTYVDLFDQYYITCLVSFVGSFVFLCALWSASSINGPLCVAEGDHQSFPVYAHLYVSMVYKQIRSNIIDRIGRRQTQHQTVAMCRSEFVIE
jgi:hypothetical protein